MRIRRLQVRDLRRYRELDIDLAPGVTVVRGQNEAGKSTIQRAIELPQGPRTLIATDVNDERLGVLWRQFAPLAKEHGKRCVAAFYSGTAPMLDYVSANPYSLKERCPEYNAAVVDFVRRKQVPNVLIVGFWVAYPIQKPGPDQPSPIQIAGRDGARHG